MTSPLLNRPISFTFSRPDRAGAYAAVVRKVVRGRRGGVRALVVQRASAEAWKAATLSARYRGESVRLEGRELELVRVLFRGRRWPLFEFLGRSVAGAGAHA
jgi:hypothetical protein